MTLNSEPRTQTTPTMAKMYNTTLENVSIRLFSGFVRSNPTDAPEQVRRAASRSEQGETRGVGSKGDQDAEGNAAND